MKLDDRRETVDSADLINAETQIIRKDLIKKPEAKEKLKIQKFEEIKENKKIEESKEEVYGQDSEVKISEGNKYLEELDLINAPTLIITKDPLSKKPQANNKKVGFALPEKEEEKEKSNKPKPEFTVTNAPTLLVQKPLEEKAKLQSSLNENLDDFDGPTQLVGHNLFEKAENSIKKKDEKVQKKEVIQDQRILAKQE